jgi:L-asparaginase II
MTDPVLVEITRGPVVESRHRGAIAIVDGAGRTRVAIGDVAQPVFPRSAVKPLQALALVESGAADRYGFGSAELALACASHNGEPRHVATAMKMLAAAGRSEADLECGTQSPAYREAADALVRTGNVPRVIHNNCSGKHSGFICVAAHRGVPVAGYVRPDHVVQHQVTSILAAMTDTVLDDRVRGVDGCSIPTFAIPLERIALGFARFVTGTGIAAERARAAARLFDAVSAEPFLIAGSDRFCTDTLTLLRGRLIVKGGAEGVYCAGFPESGLGVAIKCDDGAGRAAETVMAAVIDALLPLNAGEREAFADRLTPPILNRAGAKVGEIRMADGVGAMLAAGRG